MNTPHLDKPSTDGTEVITRCDQILQMLYKNTEGTYVDHGQILLTSAILTLAEVLRAGQK